MQIQFITGPGANGQEQIHLFDEERLIYHFDVPHDDFQQFLNSKTYNGELTFKISLNWISGAKDSRPDSSVNTVTRSIPIPSVIECSTTSKTVHGLYAELCANKIRSIEKSGNLTSGVIVLILLCTLSRAKASFGISTSKFRHFHLSIFNR